MPAPVSLNVNGELHLVAVAPATPLLYVLRNDLGLSGPKFGCGLAQCGACSVLVDGVERRSCVYPVSAVRQQKVTTVEGLGTTTHPGALQQAFLHEQAAQCGYCSSGMLIAAQALLLSNPHPSAEEVKQALDGHLCRCGTHNRIVRAVLRAAQRPAK